jgi:phage baseplate assembly protein W
MVSVSLNIARPLTIGDAGAFDADPDIAALIKQNLKNLLLTQKGERVHKRAFGTDLRHLLFEQKTDQLKLSIASEIVKAVSVWMNYVIVDAITVVYSGELFPDKFRYMQALNDNEVKVIVEYSFNVSSKTIKDILDLTVQIEGE